MGCVWFEVCAFVVDAARDAEGMGVWVDNLEGMGFVVDNLEGMGVFIGGSSMGKTKP